MPRPHELFKASCDGHRVYVHQMWGYFDVPELGGGRSRLVVTTKYGLNPQEYFPLQPSTLPPGLYWTEEEARGAAIAEAEKRIQSLETSMLELTKGSIVRVADSYAENCPGDNAAGRSIDVRRN